MGRQTPPAPNRVDWVIEVIFRQNYLLQLHFNELKAHLITKNIIKTAIFASKSLYKLFEKLARV